MSLQGNLRDFHVGEILQLLGQQTKTGCLILEGPGGPARFYVIDGRIVSARSPGDNSLLVFLRSVQRLTEEQERGILELQSQTHRDVEDIILQGRYLDADEMGQCLERQFIEELSRVARWTDGTYQFRVDEKWPHPPTVRSAVEGLLMEVARRTDEWSRFQEVLTDDHLILGLRDFPDLDEPFSDEERDLFGIIDGRRTVAEVAGSAALTRYELYESLHRMIEAGWVEVVGRREPGPEPGAVSEPGAREHSATHGAAPRRRVSGRRVMDQLREAVMLVIVAAAVVGLSHVGRSLSGKARVTKDDVFVAAQVRDVRHALELFRRAEGRYPKNLEELTDGGWVSVSHLRLPGMSLTYRYDDDRYQLSLEADR